LAFHSRLVGIGPEADVFTFKKGDDGRTRFALTRDGKKILEVK